MLRAETKDGFHRLVHEAVVKAGYPLRGLIIDAAPGWVEAWDDYFARVPLQLCRTDSRAEEHNGHSPLELGLDHDGIDWLDFLLDS